MADQDGVGARGVQAPGGGVGDAKMADFAAVRVTPAHDWRVGHLSPEVWLLGSSDYSGTLAAWSVASR